MTLLDDAVITISLAVSVASVTVLVVFLMRYRTVAAEAKRSSELAKNVWDSMNARLNVMDARIIDLMAKVDIYGVSRPPQPAKQAPRPPPPAAQPMTSQNEAVISSPIEAKTPQVEPSPSAAPAEEGEGIERRILASLVQSPKTSVEIKDLVQRSREHTARVMKLLFETGLVTRNDQVRPFVYEITEAGRRYLGS